MSTVSEIRFYFICYDRFSLNQQIPLKIIYPVFCLEYETDQIHWNYFTATAKRHTVTWTMNVFGALS